MSLLESILRQIPNLPPRKLVEAARLIHSSSEGARTERARILREAHGYLDDQDGQAFEAALASSRQIESAG